MTPSVLRGHVTAAALLFDPALIGEEEARRRIVALWSPGAAVFRCGNAYVLRLPAPRTIAASRAPGLPLVRRGSALVGFDIAPRALAQLGTLRDPTVIRFEAGTMTVVPLVESAEPADWLDLSSLTLVSPRALSAPPKAPVVLPPFEDRDVRELLNVPPLAEPEEIAQVLASLRGEPGARQYGPLTGPTRRTRSRELGSFVAGFVLTIIFALFLFFLFTQSGTDTPSPSSPVASEAARAAAVTRWNTILAILLGCFVAAVAFLHGPTRRALQTAAVAVVAWLARMFEALRVRRASRPAAPRPAPTARPAPKPQQTTSSSSGSRLWIVGVAAALARTLAAGAVGFAILGVVAVLAGVVALIVYVARSGRRRAASAPAAVAGTAPAKSQQNEIESILQQLRAKTAGASRWRTAISRFLAMTRLSALIGQMQARYLIRMLQMFEEGDLDAALRHAIPLAKDDTPSTGWAWGTPAPRSSLALSFRQSGGGTSMGFGLQVYNELKRRYRAAFERLDATRRYDEAAFVLAELLHEEEEAVAYLEKRGQLRQAALLAEARKLAPDLIVRQWMLAGDRQRAVALARRFGAFGAAVVRLEATHPETARVLRGHWGAALASAGDYSLAADVTWPVDELHAVAAAWIDRAIEQGGTTEGRMLVRRAIVRPEVRQETVERLFELLDDDDPHRVAARQAAGFALVDESLDADLRIVAGAAVRAAVRDSPLGLNAEHIRRLASHAQHDPLRADLPAIPTARPWRPEEVVELTFGAADAGAMPVYAVTSLPDGRVAAALGEGGVIVLSPAGRRLAHYDQPAYDLVVSDARDRAIALARRGEIVRLARIDFAGRTAAYWCDATLTCYARDYDGATWFAASGREILALDATAPRLEALWHNPEFPLPVTALMRDPAQLHVAGVREDEAACWRYELPSLILRDRDSTPAPRTWLVRRDDNDVLTVDLHISDAQTDACFALEGAGRVDVRIQNGQFCIGDDRGRVLVFDLERGVLTHDLRT